MNGAEFLSCPVRWVLGAHAGAGNDHAPSPMSGGSTGSVPWVVLCIHSALVTSYYRQHLLGHPDLLET